MDPIATHGSETPQAPLHAIILTGGKSRRMGTRKELLHFAGEPGLLRLVHHLQIVTPCITIVTDGTQSYDFLPPHVAIARDREPDCGPIGGIWTGMQFHEAELQLVTGCDYPLMEPHVWRQMLLTLKSQQSSSQDRQPLSSLQQNQHLRADAVVPFVYGKRHPLCAIYRRTTLPLWEKALDSRELRVMRMLEQLNIIDYVPQNDEEAAFFLNMNTVGDYEQAKERLKQ